MKRTILFIFAAAFGLTLSISPLVSAQGYQADQPSDQPSTEGAAVDQSAGSASEPVMVRGKAVSVDPEAKTITVTDVISGANRTFAVSRTEDIKDLKPGDAVSVTPQKTDESSAEKVQKE